MVRPTKRTNSGKTKVITFKLPTDEEFLISAYTESAKISKSEFLTKIINHYLLIDFSLEIHDKTLISHLVDTLNIKRNQFKDGKLHVLSVRVPRNDLEFWDFYCEHHFIPRTSLIRQAISHFFYPNGREITYYQMKKLKRVIYNIILGTGRIDINHLMLIFKDVDSSLVRKILNTWEMNGFIGQKGAERGIYVPTTEIQKSSGTMFLADLVSRFF